MVPEEDFNIPEVPRGYRNPHRERNHGGYRNVGYERRSRDREGRRY